MKKLNESLFKGNQNEFKINLCMFDLFHTWLFRTVQSLRRDQDS